MAGARELTFDESKALDELFESIKSIANRDGEEARLACQRALYRLQKIS